mmetsp:Transcript_112266/g.341710  ORF Transcript_112266/g.341710 Transcript_112266/m.341710 type:complete len:224 (+) Transcript_112266:437-1108(+)
MSPASAAASCTCQVSFCRRWSGSAAVPPWPLQRETRTSPRGARCAAALARKPRSSSRCLWIFRRSGCWGNWKTTRSNGPRASGGSEVARSVASTPCSTRTPASRRRPSAAVDSWKRLACSSCVSKVVAVILLPVPRDANARVKERLPSPTSNTAAPSRRPKSATRRSAAAAGRGGSAAGGSSAGLHRSPSPGTASSAPSGGMAAFRLPPSIGEPAARPRGLEA